MSDENIEVVREALKAFSEHGFAGEVTMGFFADDLVFEEPPEQPAPRIAEGKEAAAAMFGQFDEAWEEHVSEPVEIIAIDENRVLALTLERFRGRDGLEISQPCGNLFTLRDGKVIRLQSFWEQETARKAAGLAT